MAKSRYPIAQIDTLLERAANAATAADVNVAVARLTALINEVSLSGMAVQDAATGDLHGMQIVADGAHFKMIIDEEVQA